MFRILVATFALSILFGAAALHAQVPYTSSPYPWVQQQPRQQSPLMQQLWDNANQPVYIPQWEPEPTPRRQRRQPQSSQWDLPQETYWQKMQREDRERMQRYSDQVLQEFQNEAIERAIRCARRGSRKVYSDCFN